MFGIALITVATAFVIVFLIFLASQPNSNTTTTTTTTTGAANSPATAAPSSDAQATQTMVAFNAMAATLPRISPQDAKTQIVGGQAKVIDVRVKNIYDAEHIQGATNIPYTDAQTRLAEFPKTGNLVLYCQ